MKTCISALYGTFGPFLCEAEGEEKVVTYHPETFVSVGTGKVDPAPTIHLGGASM